MGWYFVQVNKLVGTQPECGKNRTGEGKVRTVEVALYGVVQEEEVTYSSLCQFGDKRPVPEFRPGPFEMAVAKGLQGVTAVLPGKEDPPGRLSGPLRRPRLPQFLFHRQRSALTGRSRGHR